MLFKILNDLVVQMERIEKTNTQGTDFLLLSYIIYLLTSSARVRI